MSAICPVRALRRTARSRPPARPRRRAAGNRAGEPRQAGANAARRARVDVRATTTWCRAAPAQTYICMRGFWPSPGVAKLALSMPPPSCASAFTESLPMPPRPKLFSWKLPAGFVEAGRIQDVVDAGC